MRQEVIVQFAPTRRIELALPAGTTLPAPDEGRRWLDEQFVAHDCEPLRASGKVLIADKVLAIMNAAGDDRFADADWGRQFAEAVIAATQRSLVRIDLTNRSVNY